MKRWARKNEVVLGNFSMVESLYENERPLCFVGNTILLKGRT